MLRWLIGTGVVAEDGVAEKWRLGRRRGESCGPSRLNIFGLVGGLPGRTSPKPDSEDEDEKEDEGEDDGGKTLHGFTKPRGAVPELGFQKFAMFGST